MFTTKLRVKMLAHNFLDKLEMTTHAVISSLLRIAADYLNSLTYKKSNILNFPQKLKYTKLTFFQFGY